MTQGFQNDPGTVQQEAGFGFDGPFWKESDLPNLTAFAGGGQANATLLNAMFNRIATVASANDSVKLPPTRLSLIGCTIGVCNDAVNTVQLFGSGNDTINGIAALGSVPLIGKSLADFSCTAVRTLFATGLEFGYGTGGSSGFTTYSTQDSITAFAGGGQASGVLITGAQARITTVATAADSVRLPPAVAGMEITLTNDATANACNVFPSSQAQGGVSGGDKINAVAQNGAFSLTVAAGPTIFYCFTTGSWRTK